MSPIEASSRSERHKFEGSIIAAKPYVAPLGLRFYVASDTHSWRCGLQIFRWLRQLVGRQNFVDSVEQVYISDMDYNEDKVDEMVLALLHLTSSRSHGIVRAWKGHDWDALDRLHQKGLISDPKSKSKSVVLSDDGARKAQELFERLCGS